MPRNSNRGFAAMDAQRQREIASLGGRAAHRSGNAHQFDSREAREAGRRGGEAVSRDRQHMAEIGARGGHNSHGGRAQSGSTPVEEQADVQDDDRDRFAEPTSRETRLRPDHDERATSGPERHGHDDEPAGGRSRAGSADGQ
jgi:general stress protein YciG